MKRVGWSVALLLIVSGAGAWGEPAVDGAALYASQCALCHGDGGGGDGMAAGMLDPRPTNFTAAGYWQRADRDALRKTVREGRPGTGMAGFAGKLTAEQIDAVLAYLEKVAAR